MREHVWLITDAFSGEVSYFQVGPENQEQSWHRIGPFVFRQQDDLQRAVETRSFVPVGVDGTFSGMPVETVGFIRAIFNGFSPVETDVFVLDMVPYPLTLRGAQWVDDALGAPIWSELFESGTEWLDKVLSGVAHVLEVSAETLQAIGSVNAAAEDENLHRQDVLNKVVEHVQIRIAPERGTLVSPQGEMSRAVQFWLFTHGLDAFGLPELEIRNVPCLWMEAAAVELKTWAALAIEQEGLPVNKALVHPGGRHYEIRFVPSEDPLWQSRGMTCLTLELCKILFRLEKSDSGPTLH